MPAYNEQHPCVNLRATSASVNICAGLGPLLVCAICFRHHNGLPRAVLSPAWWGKMVNLAFAFMLLVSKIGPAAGLGGGTFLLCVSSPINAEASPDLVNSLHYYIDNHSH